MPTPDGTRAMGLRGRESIHGPALFFATSSTDGMQKWFDSTDRLRRLQTILFDTVRIKKSHLLGYVLMPNHVHLLIGVRGGGMDVAKFMHSFKIMSAKSFSPRGGIWQDRFDDLAITSEEQFRIKLAYIHRNPVRAGLAEAEIDWPFSSVRLWADMEGSDILTKDFGWMENDKFDVAWGTHGFR